ncbi:hypothetical protein D3C73_1349890 [compost metagenome]
MAIKPTTGPEIAPPNGVPDIEVPSARARCFGVYQLLTILLVVTLNGPSPMPKRMRMNTSEANPIVSTVRPLNSDHSTMASNSVVFAP